MKTNDQYFALMKKMKINTITINEFKKAFDVTPSYQIRSYRNQKYVSLGQRALHLLYADLSFNNNDISEIFDTYEYRIGISNFYNLYDYAYTENDYQIYESFIIESSLFEAIVGLIFLNLGYDKMKKWHNLFLKNYLLQHDMEYKYQNIL